MCNPGQASVRKDPLFNLSCVLQFEKKAPHCLRPSRASTPTLQRHNVLQAMKHAGLMKRQFKLLDCRID